jgi:hypothetical protein
LFLRFRLAVHFPVIGVNVALCLHLERCTYAMVMPIVVIVGRREVDTRYRDARTIYFSHITQKHTT